MPRSLPALTLLAPMAALLVGCSEVSNDDYVEMLAEGLQTTTGESPSASDPGSSIDPAALADFEVDLFSDEERAAQILRILTIRHPELVGDEAASDPCPASDTYGTPQ